jgi:RNA polymerase sigma factor (sigma-70 family)
MNPDSFQQLVLTLTDPLFRFALWRLGQREEAEDAVQETFLRMWKMRNNLNRYERPDYLAFHILRNWCIDRARKKKVEWEDWSVYVENAKDLLTPQRQMELQEELHQVEKAAQQLPEQQRTILFLRNVEGYSTKEVANMLGLKVNTVEVNLSRARRRLRKVFQK